ncbi:MAG TPA: HAD-IA family hydrolase [Casimicrobiaceae bacterium]
MIAPGAQRLAVSVVLFDLDGTLADSAGDLAHAVNTMREHRGMAPVAVESLRPHASAGARGLLGSGMGVTPDDPDYPLLRDEFLANYAAGLARSTRLFDGVPELLEALDARRVRWGIVTNKAARFTAQVVAALGLAGRAATVVSGDTAARPKPHPEPLLHAAAALGVQADACVYVGDDLRDVTAGNAANMPTIVARYGYLGGDTDPSSWPATGSIEHPLDLLDWLPG